MTEITTQQALARLQNLCSRSEKCIADARIKLTAWQIPTNEADKIVTRLVEDKYIDEERYTLAFVRDKSRFSHWGALKIQMALRAKKISADIISKALVTISQADYSNELEKILLRKIQSVKAKSPADLKTKLIRFALSRGFEYEMVYTCVSKIMKNTPDD